METFDPLYLYFTQHDFCEQDRDRPKERAFIEACADRKAHDTGCPEAGRCGESLNGSVAGDNDRTCADKAQSGDDLRPQTAHVGGESHHQINKVAGQGSSSRTGDDENMGSEAGGPVLYGTLDSDRAAA